MSKQHLLDYYQGYNELNRLATPAQSIEFITTTRVLEDLLAPRSSILDLGCGAGRYALYFSQRGHTVTAIDPVPKHIRQLRAMSEDEPGSGQVETQVADHTFLRECADQTYDTVLCLGPVYHLLDEEERRCCVSDCLRVVKTGGLAAFAYINKYFILPFQATLNRKFLDREYIRTLVESGTIPSDHPCCGWTDCYYCSPEEAVDLVSQPGVQVEAHVAADGISILLQRMVDDLDDDQFSIWLEYHLETCKEPSLLGYSNHGLIVCRKE